MGRSTQLRSALRDRFFGKVEADGFVRDERNQPHITCFRRKVGSVVQVFAVQWEKRGHPWFKVTFTEAPAEGFDYLGTHVAADQATPGHFTLARGLIRPRRNIFTGSWFRLDRPLISRLTSGQRDYKPDYVVGQFLALFPEVIAWWERKTVGKHISVRPPMPKATHEKLKQKMYAKLRQNTSRVA